MLTDFIIVYGNTTEQTIKAYSVEFKPGFALFYDGHTTKAINSNTIREIKWAVTE